MTHSLHFVGPSAIVLMRSEPTRRYWTDADHTGMKAWLQAYSTWCLTSPLGQGARFLVNDIGNAMVMSLLAQGLFLGDNALSHTFATNDSKRVMNLLIDGKGRFPMEVRTSSTTCAAMPAWSASVQYLCATQF